MDEEKGEKKSFAPVSLLKSLWEEVMLLCERIEQVKHASKERVEEGEDKR